MLQKSAVNERKIYLIFKSWNIEVSLITKSDVEKTTRQQRAEYSDIWTLISLIHTSSYFIHFNTNKLK